MTPSRLLRAISVFSVLISASFAGAATTEFRVLFDADRNSTTGCRVAGMDGVDHVLVTVVNESVSTAEVTRVFRQVCTGASLGPIVDDDVSGWPAAFRSGPRELTFETRIRQTAFGAGGIVRDMRLGFQTVRGSANQTALLDVDGTEVIIPESAGRRRAARSPGAPRVIVYDGGLSDWAELDSVIYGIAGQGTRDLRVLRVFAYDDFAGPPANTYLSFAVIARVGSDDPFAVDDVYNRQAGQSLLVPGPGVLANDGDPLGQDLDAVLVTGPARGSVALNEEEGGFTYSPNNPESKATDSFEYKVRAGTRESNVARVKVKVRDGDGNEPPSFTSGGNVTVAETSGLYEELWATNISPGAGETQTVAFTVTNNNNDLFSTQPSIAPDGKLKFTPKPNTNGSATVTVILKDSEGAATAPVTFIITVTNVNNAPSFTVGPNQTVPEDSGPQTVSPWATGISPGPADESGQTVSFTVTGNSNPSLFSAGPSVSPTGVLTYTPAPNAHGVATITLRLTDSGSPAATSSQKQFTITITPVNDLPSFTAGGNITVNEDSGVFSATWATAVSAGPNEATQAVSFIVSNNNNGLFAAQPAIAPDGTLTFTPAANANGPATVSVTLTDSAGGSTAPAVTFQITVTSINDAPSFVKGADLVVLDTAGLQTVNGWATSLNTGAPNESGQVLDFIVSNNAPALFSVAPSIAPDGTLTYTPAPGQQGVATVTVQIHDNGGTANGGVDTSAAQTFTITVEKIPTITSGNTTTFLAGQNGTFSVTTTGLPRPSIAQGGALPTGVSFVDGTGPTKGTGVLSGTPAALTGGSYPLTFQATNVHGSSAVQNFTLVVNEAPGITSANTATFTQGSAGTFTLTTIGYPAPSLTLTGATLPAGLTFTDNLNGTGTISGTPTAAGGSYSGFVVTAANGVGTNATQNLTVVINQVPAITSANATQFNATVAATFTVTTTGFPTPALSQTGALPTGITFTDNGNGTATLGGTALQGTGGTYTITINATNTAGTTPQTFTITVCNVIAVTNPATASGPAGSPFSQTFTQTGAVGSATFTLASGTLPTGLALAANGVLSGTPTQGGSFPITVLVTDANGCTGVGSTYNLVITCPTITVSNPANANGTANSPFSETFTQSGSVGTPAFSIASGTLPAGLALATNGVLSGTPTQTGSFPITVTATDANGCTGTGPTYTIVVGCQTITVTNPANANGTANSAFSETFTNSGAIGSVTYTLASGTLPAGLTLATNGVLSGTPTQTGSFPVTVTVTDGNGCTGTGSTYTVVIGCQTITVTNPANANGTANSAFSETFTNTGAIGAVTYTLASGALPTGLTLATNGVLSGTPTQTGSFPITVTATDANGCTGTSGTYTIVIACQTITVTNPSGTAGTVGSAFSQTFTQTGAIGSATFTTASTLPAGLTLATNGVLSGTPTQAGSFPIVVTVTDGNGCTGNGSTYTLVIGCQTITVTNPVNATGPAGSPFSETFTQTGASGTATFTLASGTLPSGLTLATNGILSGTPTQGGSFPITVTVTDANGCTGTGGTYTIVITCPTITITSPANANGTAGSAFAETFTQTGGQGTVTWTLASGTLPAGLTLATSGTISGTPTQTGSFPITVLLTDANGCTATSGGYTIVIACQTITVNNPASANGTANSAFSQTFTNTGAIGAATYTLASGTLPAGLTLAANGVLAGTPTQTGSFPVTVTVTDSNGCTGTGATYTIVIACQTITVTSPANANGTLGAAFSETFTQTGAIGSATFTLASGTLPAGLTLATSGVLSGTPTATGSFPITVTVTDANGCTGTSTTYTLVIACQSITVTNPANANGTVGSVFSETFTQSGATGTAMFTTASTLPAGITLSTAGVLSGTPTQAGNFPIVVTVTDSNGCTGTSSTYTLVIVCQTITVTSPANANGTVGSAFSETFTQTGGIGTTNFTLASGTLPTGLTLATTGVLSGTPTQAGSFPITVTATDSNGCTGTSSTYTLVIVCQVITVNNPATTTGTVDAAFSQTFTNSGAIGAVTYTLASGTLPSGLTLAANGTLSGTPGQPGSFPITVTVTDANGCSGTGATYTLVIACQTITVTNPGTTTATYNAAFSQTFTQSGVGTHTPAVWSVTGTLPAGLSLNTSTGVLSGTPTQTGTFPITVTVTDANNCAGTGATYNLAVAPVAVADSFSNAASNTQYVLTGGTTATPSTPTIQTAGTIKVNDLPSAATVTVVAGVFATTNGGSVTIAADGTYLYTPPAQPGIAPSATDTFTYTVTSNTGGTGPVTSAPATVTINLANRVWYVKNDSAAGGDGRSHQPFDTLAEAQTASTANDIIYVYFGNGTTTGQNAGIALKNGQKLYGQGIALVVNTQTLVIAGSQPLIGNSAGVGVSAANLSGVVEVKGLSISATADAVLATLTAGVGSIEVSNNTVTGAGAQGIDVEVTGGTFTVSIHDNSVTATGTAIEVTRTTAGTVQITTFDDNVVSGSSAGTGISVSSDVVGNVVFDGTAGGAYQPVSGGITAIGVTGNGVGASGLLLTNVAGDLNFTDLDIVADNGTGLLVTGSGAVNTGAGTGTRVTVTAGVAVIQSIGGPAVDVNNATIDLQLADLDSTSTTTRGVSLVNVADGTTSARFSAPAGSTITSTAGATGPLFNVSGGNVGVSYGGTIVNSGTGRAVLVDSLSMDDGTDDVTFSGAITENGAGILLNANSGNPRTINFSGGLTISTSTGEGFSATSNTNTGGLNITGTNTITSTSATALRITNTTIGGSNATFQRISSGNATAAADPASGIILTTTGGTGRLIVTGNGAACSSLATCTGGAIQNTTSHGILMSNTLNPSFTRVAIQNTAGSGIEGTQVAGFTLDASFIDNSGTAGLLEDSNVSFDLNSTGTDTNLSGVVNITNNTLTNSRRHGVRIQNFNGTISDLVITGNTMTSSTAAANSLGSGIQILPVGSTTTVSNVTKANISNNTITNFPSDGGIEVKGGNSTAAGPGGTMGVPGDATNIINITGNAIRGQSAANPMNTSFIDIGISGGNAGSRSQANFNISNNGTVASPLAFTKGIGIGLGNTGYSTSTVTMNNNVVSPGNVFASAGIGGGNGVVSNTAETPDLSWTMTGNTISNADGNGILAVARAINGLMKVKIQNNTVAAPLTGVRPGIRIDAGNTTVVGSGTQDAAVCLNISGNTSAGSGGTQGIGLRKQGTVATTNDFGIHGLPGGSTATPNVEAYVNSQNPAGGGTLLISATSGFSTCSFP